MIATEPTSGQLAPTSVVILGAAGDLTRRKLLPALYNLFRDELLPEPFSVVGFARREMDDDSFRELTRKSLNEPLAFRGAHPHALQTQAATHDLAIGKLRHGALKATHPPLPPAV